MMHAPIDVDPRGGQPAARFVLVAGALVGLAGLHAYTSTDGDAMRSLHVLGRQAFALPVLLTAIWARPRWVAAVCGGITAFYAGHVLMQWSGSAMEHLTEISEVSLLWMIGLGTSFLVIKERRALAERAETSEGALVALVMAIDARERDTRLHSLRVRAYAMRLGRSLGITGDALLALGQGALLHDIGKIGIPDAILLKPGKLDAEEWTVMRRHASLGAEMVASVPFLSAARDLILCHHERFDGKGYPRGLGGSEIPFGARIFAYIDAYDALTSERPYHRAMPAEEAVRKLHLDRGTHFDPAVVDAFEQIPLAEWRALRDAIHEESRA